MKTLGTHLLHRLVLIDINKSGKSPRKAFSLQKTPNRNLVQGVFMWRQRQGQVKVLKIHQFMKQTNITKIRNKDKSSKSH